MSTAPGTVGPVRTGGQEKDYAEYEEQHGYGWVLFAGVMIVMVGVVNMIYGIAAIANSQFYVANTHFVFGELKTWGWVVLLIGVLQIVVGWGIWAQQSWARWTGVFIACLNAVAHLMFIAASPWLSLAIFTVDIFVVYALIAYGGRLEER